MLRMTMKKVIPDRETHAFPGSEVTSADSESLMQVYSLHRIKNIQFN